MRIDIPDKAVRAEVQARLERFPRQPTDRARKTEQPVLLAVIMTFARALAAAWNWSG